MTHALRRAMRNGAVIVLAALLGIPAAAQDPPADVADTPAELAETARIAAPAEPGEPIEIAGTLVAPDGKTPVVGAVVYAYHTDAKGEYGGTSERPRLRGWARTDASGRFTFLTSKPGPYPGGRAPAHIHVHVWGAGHPRQWWEFLFPGDPRLPATIPQHFLVLTSAGNASGRQGYAATLVVRTQSNFTNP